MKLPEKQAFLSLSYVIVGSSPRLPVPSTLKSHSATSDLETSICALNFAVKSLSTVGASGKECVASPIAYVISNLLKAS